MGLFSFLNIFNHVRKAVLDIDSIYLTREDLDKIMAADLSKFGIFCSAFCQVVPQGASIPAEA